MTQGAHQYAARLVWDGNTGEGTASYTGYGRQYRVLIAGKPDLTSGLADRLVDTVVSGWRPSRN